MVLAWCLKKQNRHRDTESQRRGRIRSVQKCQQILTLFVLIFLCVSVSRWLRLVFHQPVRASRKIISPSFDLPVLKSGYAYSAEGDGVKVDSNDLAVN